MKRGVRPLRSGGSALLGAGQLRAEGGDLGDGGADVGGAVVLDLALEGLEVRRDRVGAPGERGGALLGEGFEVGADLGGGHGVVSGWGGVGALTRQASHRYAGALRGPAGVSGRSGRTRRV